MSIPIKFNTFDVSVVDQLQLFTQFNDSVIGPMAQLWNSYLDMIDLLLRFIRASKEGNMISHPDTHPERKYILKQEILVPKEVQRMDIARPQLTRPLRRPLTSALN